MTSINWAARYASFEKAIAERDSVTVREVVKEARTLLQNRKLQEVEWIEDALTSSEAEAEEKRSFITMIFDRGEQMPERLFEPMVYAAVHCADLSSPRLYISPLIRCYGAVRTNERLLEYLEDGTNTERAGAVAAMYWSFGSQGEDSEAEVRLDELYDEARKVVRRVADEVDEQDLRERMKKSSLYGGGA